jgi:hypothetical protein
MRTPSGGSEGLIDATSNSGLAGVGWLCATQVKRARAMPAISRVIDELLRLCAMVA